LKQKNDPRYLVRAGFNLLLVDNIPSVRRKLWGFINILSILEDLASNESFALIKVHPMMMRIGNDADVFISKASLERIMQVIVVIFQLLMVKKNLVESPSVAAFLELFRAKPIGNKVIAEASL